MPRHDLIPPAADGPAQRPNLGWHRGVAEIVGELINELGGEDRIGDHVDLPGGLFRMPHHPHLAMGVTGVQQATKLGIALVVEPFVRLGQQPSGSIQRVVFAAAVAERFVLDAASARIQFRVRQDIDDRVRAYAYTTEEATLRLRLEEAVTAYADVLRARFPDTFGGLWIEDGPPPRVVVTVTSEEAIKAEDFVAGDFSYAEALLSRLWTYRL